MKKLILFTSFITIAIFSAVVYSGCTKADKCADITCQHGGTCSDGVCKCPTGYLGANCETRTCEANKTATVKFTNKTGSSLTYAVVWDGSTITTIAPGATSSTYTVSAGQHTLHFMIANTTNEACTISSPNLAACENQEYWCTK